MELRIQEYNGTYDRQRARVGAVGRSTSRISTHRTASILQRSAVPAFRARLRTRTRGRGSGELCKARWDTERDSNWLEYGRGRRSDPERANRCGLFWRCVRAIQRLRTF